MSIDKIIIPISNLEIEGKLPIELDGAIITYTNHDVLKKSVEGLINSDIVNLDLYANLMLARSRSIYQIETSYSSIVKNYLNIGTKDDDAKNIRKENIRIFLDKVLVLFKLFDDSGPIRIHPIFEQVGDSLEIWGPMYYVPWGAQMTMYIIKEEEINKFVDFWNYFKEIPTNCFPIRRFFTADFEPTMDDRFVNCVFGLESLLVPDSADGEITKKFMTNGALVLGVNESEQEQILKIFLAAYDFRSIIVHDGAELIKSRDEFIKVVDPNLDPSWNKAVNYVMSYLRKSIIFFYKKGLLENSENRKDYIKYLRAKNRYRIAELLKTVE